MLKLGDRIAQCVLETFRKLPAKAKPRSYGDGSREWVPLSGIVLAKANTEDAQSYAEVHESAQDELTCVSVG